MRILAALLGILVVAAASAEAGTRRARRGINANRQLERRKATPAAPRRVQAVDKVPVKAAPPPSGANAAPAAAETPPAAPSLPQPRFGGTSVAPTPVRSLFNEGR